MAVSVLLAFANAPAREAVARALTRYGVAVAGAFGDGASLLRASRALGPCLVLVGPKLPDFTPGRLRQSLEPRHALAVLCRAGECDTLSDVARFPLPASGAELAALAKRLMAETAPLSRPARRTAQEEELVAQAKARIMQKTGCDEAQAHRSLQRMCMERGLRLADGARRVLGE